MIDTASHRMIATRAEAEAEKIGVWWSRMTLEIARNR